MTNLVKLNAYIYGSQAFAKLFEQHSYTTVHQNTETVIQG